MCILIISISHKHMLPTTAYHQNKSYSESIRQYAKRRTEALLPSAYLFIEITKCHQNYLTFRRMSRGCHLMIQCQKHAKISYGKVLLTYMYKIIFPFFNDTYLWNLINIMP